MIWAHRKFPTRDLKDIIRQATWSLDMSDLYHLVFKIAHQSEYFWAGDAHIDKVLY